MEILRTLTDTIRDMYTRGMDALNEATDYKSKLSPEERGRLRAYGDTVTSDAMIVARETGIKLGSGKE